MKIILIGGSGLVGSKIVRRFNQEGVEIIGTYRTSPTKETSVRIDKRDPAAVSELVSDRDPDVVVDVAAFHDVDKCESLKDKAWSVNAAGTKNVAVAADSIDAHLIYLSTDYVFQGDPSQSPYTEDDPVKPVNYYGQTKYAGEQAAKIPSEWTILRSSVLYGVIRDNFLTWALEQIRETGNVKVVDDQIGSITYAADIAEACLRIATEGLTGLFHAAGPESISRHEFTRRLAEAFGYPPELVDSITTEELDQRAPRPRNSTLDSTKLYDMIDYTFRDSETVLKQISH